MIALGIAAIAITAAGVVQSVRLVATDGYRRVPTRTYPHMLNLR